MSLGIIIKGIGGFYYVKTQDGIFECRARGIFRKDKITPLPGDRVCISVTDNSKMLGSVDEILPRKSQFVRPAVANVDQFVVVLAVKSPETDFVLLDKLLITAELKNISVIICMNKMDLDQNEGYRKIKDVYESINYKVILLSSEIEVGFDELKDALRERVTVFAGQSGVGKSTILNKIMNSWVMQTGVISEKIERGKHTTRHAELLELDTGGFVVDTPGFSSFELEGIKYDELECYYPEFKEHLNKCRFTGCSHIREPGCSVKEAVDKQLIDAGRYERYTQLYNSLKLIKDYKNKK